MANISPEELRRLDGEATGGTWRNLSLGGVYTDGAVDTYSGPILMRIISAEETEQADSEGRVASCSGSAKANAAFIAALVNAYRAGLLIHADEVREVLAMVGNALNAAFAAGMEEREGGSGSRQGKELEKVETCRKAARALLAKLPPNGAKGE